MKKIPLILLFFVSSLCGTTKRELFAKGLLFFQHNNVKSAQETFEHLAPTSTRALANLGICYQQLGDMPKALACWLGVQQRGSFTEVRYTAQAMDLLGAAADKKMQLPWYQKVWGWCPLMLLVVQLCFLLSWFGLFYYVGYVRNKMIALCATVSILFGFFMTTALATSRIQSLVVASGTPVFVGPCEQYHTSGKLEPLDIVQWSSYKDGWYKIVCGSNHGWVSEQSVIRV